MSKKVRAAVILKPGEIQVHEFPYPSLGAGAMIIEMELCGICGTDKHTYRGETTQYGGTKAEMRTPFPIILGHEIVGIAVEIDKKAHETIKALVGEEIKVGDRVVVCPDIFCGHCYYCRNYCGFIWCDNTKVYGNNLTCQETPHLFGGWAEYMYLLPNTFVFKVPDSIKPEVAVLTELMTVTYNLDKAKEFYSMSGDGFKTGDTVVIQGVGPMGLCHIIKARMLGAGDIVAIDGSNFRLNMAKQFGADVCLSIKDTPTQERVQAVKDLTNGVGADVVVECTGVTESIIEGLELVRKGGMYIVAGVFVDTGEVSINPHRHLCAKNIRLLGQTNHPPSGYLPSLKLMEKFDKFFPPFERIVTHRFGLEEAQQAMEQSMNAESSMKVVIDPKK